MTSTKLVDGKTAIVTGGASGIGRDIAITFAKHGADVVVADKRAEPRMGGMPTVEKIRSDTAQSATLIKGDVSDPQQASELVEAAKEFGGPDVLVNNAAIAREDDFDVTPEEFDEFMATNIRGYFFPAKETINYLLDNDRKGSIINISSTEAIRTPAARPVYASTRGAIRNMTFGLAGRLGPSGIRANVIHPGLFETAMVTDDIPLFDSYEALQDRIPLQRHGEEGEIGGPTVFLASDLASYITGAELLVDGGITYVSG